MFNDKQRKKLGVYKRHKYNKKQYVNKQKNMDKQL